MLSPFVALRVNSAKHLARGAPRCFAALSMTGLDLSVDKNCQVHLNLALEKIVLDSKAGGSAARTNTQLVVDRLSVPVDRERA
jgi:hypothetical protein